jgi:hypothetical protein
MVHGEEMETGPRFGKRGNEQDRVTRAIMARENSVNPQALTFITDGPEPISG